MRTCSLVLDTIQVLM